MEMKTFIVYSDIPAGATDTSKWLRGIRERLSQAAWKNVNFKTAYCCTPDRKIIAEFEAKDEKTLRKALDEIGMRIADLMEATKV
jgi:hypothetical protein